MASKRRRRRPIGWHWRTLEDFDPGLAAAILAAGSMTALAQKLGIKPQAICQWETIPAKRIIQVERVTKVAREKLRPDLYRRRAA